MPGHMGAATHTVQNLRILQVDAANNLLTIQGAIPGYKNSYVSIRFSRKKLYKSLDEKKVVHEVKRNPMKLSKAKATGKGK